MAKAMIEALADIRESLAKENKEFIEFNTDLTPVMHRIVMWYVHGQRKVKKTKGTKVAFELVVGSDEDFMTNRIAECFDDAII